MRRGRVKGGQAARGAPRPMGEAVRRAHDERGAVEGRPLLARQSQKIIRSHLGQRSNLSPGGPPTLLNDSAEAANAAT
jgi:hypothetical protein